MKRTLTHDCQTMPGRASKPHRDLIWWGYFILVLGTLFGDGFIQFAGAQCRPGDGKVYIDPRLVRQRPAVSRQQFEALEASPWASPEEKTENRNEYMNQNQPIEMPYAGGRVLISPKNPCIQQFIPN
jgi:hypothetical protein